MKGSSEPIDLPIGETLRFEGEMPETNGREEEGVNSCQEKLKGRLPVPAEGSGSSMRVHQADLNCIAYQSRDIVDV